MPVIHRLKALAVERTKEPGMYADGAGLYLQVARGGSKSWIFRYRFGGREREMGLGPLHTVSLAEAREAALEARKLKLKGIDPIQAKRSAALDQRLEAVHCSKAHRAGAMRIRRRRGPAGLPSVTGQAPAGSAAGSVTR